MEIFQKVKSIIKANKENCTEVLHNDDLVEDLGIDSLDTLMIINDIEDEFAIEFDVNDLETIKTVNDITRMLECKYLKPNYSHGI